MQAAVAFREASLRPELLAQQVLPPPARPTLAEWNRDNRAIEWYRGAFTFDEMVFWYGKGQGVSFEEAIAKVDTIVTGPHAGVAFPEEFKPFVSDRLTRRNQYDYSDVATGPVGRAWAARDER
eukprot:2847981-Prymnesium_polylepis.1